MTRRDEVAARMADAVIRRLTTRKVIEVKDEAAARAAVRQVVVDNVATEEKIDAEARQMLLERAKLIKDHGADYRVLLGKVKVELAKKRGFIL
jgi:hypothetical protein